MTMTSIIVNLVIIGAVVLWLAIRVDNLKDQIHVLENRIKWLEEKK